MFSKPKKALVTVGTTKFNRLVDAVCNDNVFHILRYTGYVFVQCQVGRGRLYEPDRFTRMPFKCDRYIENFSEEIDKYDLIISHGGAGTILEALRKKKWLIVVINEKLMDNHQMELSEELAARGHLFYCYPKNLAYVLEFADLKRLKPYPSNTASLGNYLDECMGFE